MAARRRRRNHRKGKGCGSGATPCGIQAGVDQLEVAGVDIRYNRIKGTLTYWREYQDPTGSIRAVISAVPQEYSIGEPLENSTYPMEIRAEGTTSTWDIQGTLTVNNHFDRRSNHHRTGVGCEEGVVTGDGVDTAREDISSSSSEEMMTSVSSLSSSNSSYSSSSATSRRCSSVCSSRARSGISEIRGTSTRSSTRRSSSSGDQRDDQTIVQGVVPPQK